MNFHLSNILSLANHSFLSTFLGFRNLEFARYEVYSSALVKF